MISFAKICVISLLLFGSSCTAFRIYADMNLFEYPHYNYSAAFEQFAGLPAGSVDVDTIPDWFLVDLSSTANFSSGDHPDIILGISNILQHKLPQNTFLQYNSPQVQFIDPHLYAQVSGFNLFPYEYGRVTIIGNRTRIGTKYDPSTISLHDLTSNTEILRTLIVEDPHYDTTGASFLFGSIATFGDPKAGIVGEVAGSDWQTWWKSVVLYAHVESSWSDAWELFQKNENYSLMVSYELHPSYYACIENKTDIVALNLANDQWNLIHSVGIFNQTQNVTLAQQFVDWWLSPSIQTLIPDHEWMFPARNNISFPSCFTTNVSANPEFNEILNSTTISANYKTWISEWLSIYYDRPRTTSSTSGAKTWFVSGVLAFVCTIFVFI